MIEKLRKQQRFPVSDIVHVAKFDPAQPLDDLRKVALMASPQAELAVVEFSARKVLIVQYPRSQSGAAWTDWAHVNAGDWLEYDDQYRSLGSRTDAEIAQHYVKADQHALSLTWPQQTSATHAATIKPEAGM